MNNHYKGDPPMKFGDYPNPLDREPYEQNSWIYPNMTFPPIKAKVKIKVEVEFSDGSKDSISTERVFSDWSLVNEKAEAMFDDCIVFIDEIKDVDYFKVEDEDDE